MPTNYIQEIADKTKIPIKELESIWNKAITEAEKKNIKQKYAYATAALHHVAKAKGMDAESQRYIDANGALICPNSVITGSDVASYFGGEIPNWQRLNLNERQVYQVYRPINEMIDNDFNGKHVLERHIGDFEASTFAQYKDDIVGVAYDCVQDGTEIKGTIAFNDPKAIDALEDGKKYLSAGYWYDPVLEKGVYNGMAYDIKMTNIRANHIAHVENPRYKKAIVGDNDNVNSGVNKLKFKEKYPSLYRQFAKMGLDEDLAEKAISAMDEKEQEEADKKAADACAKDEEEKKKAEDEKAELEEKAKKAEDELEAVKGVVHAKEKGQDSNALAEVVSKVVAHEMSKFEKQFTARNMAMDGAMTAYTQRFGSPSKAFDSPDAVYDAILAHEGMNYKGKSLNQKMAMVEVLESRPSQAGYVNVGMDSGFKNNDFSYLSAEDRKLLGV